MCVMKITFRFLSASLALAILSACGREQTQSTKRPPLPVFKDDQFEISLIAVRLPSEQSFVIQFAEDYNPSSRDPRGSTTSTLEDPSSSRYLLAKFSITPTAKAKENKAEYRFKSHEWMVRDSENSEWSGSSAFIKRLSKLVGSGGFEANLGNQIISHQTITSEDESLLALMFIIPKGATQISFRIGEATSASITVESFGDWKEADAPQD